MRQVSSPSLSEYVMAGWQMWASGPAFDGCAYAHELCRWRPLEAPYATLEDCWIVIRVE